MSFLSNPKVLYFVRLLQICLASATLVLVCYAGVHRSWWGNINGALAVGVITCIFTLVLGFATIWIQHRSNPFSGGSKIHTIARLAGEVFLLLLWVATATLMLRHKSGCEEREGGAGFDACSDGHGSKRIRYSDQPIISWDIAIAFTFVEIVGFFLSTVLVFLSERASKVPSGGASYA